MQYNNQPDNCYGWLRAIRLLLAINDLAVVLRAAVPVVANHGYGLWLTIRDFAKNGWVNHG